MSKHYNIPTKILILSANPKNTLRLRIEEEVREIEEGLVRSRKRDAYSIETAEAVRYKDIYRAILDHEPHIIHFSGHGSGEEGLAFEDETGQIKLVDAEALAGLFQLFADRVKCVVLDACYSRYQAKEIARHVNYVVGISKEIQDKAAIEFAVAFYDAIGADRGYEFAYKLGCSFIRIAGIPNQLVPQLITKNSLQLEHSQKTLSDTSTKEQNINAYVERPPVEEKCYKAIVQPGALIRIKAPQKMGKTLLLHKLLDYARQQGYKTVKLDLKLADINILTNFKTFLQWLCTNVSDGLELEPQLDNYWQDILGLNINCTRYFQRYLLSVTDSPLVFAIDNFERLFEYPEIYSQFCLLLRAWYENAKQGDKIGNIWKKLRLVVVHSTEPYLFLDLNHSPFNIGLAIDLPEFSQQQVKTLVEEYELDDQLGEQGLSQLTNLVGGNPYLIKQILINLKMQKITLDQLLKQDPTEQDIFSDHLQQQLWNLQQSYQIEAEYKKVVTAKSPVRLEPEVAYKLHSLGLIKFAGNDCVPGCDLYTQYFSKLLG